MLYFVYNSEIVSVLVAHSFERGEFVLQIPYYPPIQQLDNFDADTCKLMINQTVGSNIELSDVELLDIGHWDMSGVVYSKLSEATKGIALAGDSAHAYPPSGGFGMNTGIGDAFNLAFKIQKGLASKDNFSHELEQYSNERFIADKATLDLAMHNYAKSVNIAYKLGLDLNSILGFKDVMEELPSTIGKPLFDYGSKFGLSF